MTSEDPIPMPLPCPVPPMKWHLVTDEFRRTKSYYPALQAAFRDACAKPGWNPKTVQLAGKLIAIDFCASHETGEFHSYKTAIIDDHPFLERLPHNAPRAVRHPYLAATRLRYARMCDALSYLEDMRRAERSAWDFNEMAWRQEVLAA